MALPLSYHWRNLFVRKTTTTLTVLVVAAVVATLAWILGFTSAMQRSLSLATEQEKIIVINRGAPSEISSALPIEDFNKLSQLRDVARDPNTGDALISPEMLVQVALPRLRDQGRTTANVAVRGVTEKAFQVHRNVRPLGAVFAAGAQEVIVGVKTAEQFAGVKVGDTLNLGYSGNRGYKVVGLFTAGGGPMESEIWGYLPSLLSAYNRSMYSAATLRLPDGTDPHPTVTQIAGPAIQLHGQTEADYWRDQSSRIRVYMGIVYGLVCIMSIAAAFAIANTMFSAVAGRVQEIAMLRTIGFRPRQILLGFVLEAVLLALLGGLLGCVACAAWLELIGHTKDMYGSTSFTTLAFDIRLTPFIVVIALLTVSLMGAAGAFFPAWRASRVEVIAALREA
jgi:putative ABC transport system permease protein